MNPRECSDEILLSDVTKLVGSHRELTAKLVAHLAEIEERRLHLVAGYSSMFDFCQKKLGMGEGEAFRRILAARLSRRFPVVLSLLASGSVNLSTLELLRERLTEENHEELLPAVAHRSKREVQAYLASRFPRPDVPSTIRSIGASRSFVEPLSDSRFRVEFTASAALRDKLELCRDLMSHANPSRDLAEVVERGVDVLLAKLEKERLGRIGRPREAALASSAVEKAHVTRATRRRVFERDGLRCTYVSPEGRRCETRAFLELDHAMPRALGGDCGAENLRVRCRAHNQLWAAQVFGLETVERARHFRQQKCNGPATTGAFEKAHRALRNLGFRETEARRAVAEVAKTHTETLTPERALREALLVATSGCG